MRMSFFQRRALGALLAASAVNPAIGIAEAGPSPPSPSSPTTSDKNRLSSVLSKASKISDSHLNDPPATAATITSTAEAVRARALLGRYYAMSSEAQASNQKSQPQTSSTPSSRRTPATDVFEPIYLNKGSKPISKRYVICGGGTAAWAAIEAILKSDPKAARDILLVTDESYLPYNRTMLSKEMWHDKPSSTTTTATTPTSNVEYAYRHVSKDSKVAVLKETRAVRLDVDDKVIEMSNGALVQYDKVLLVTGGHPKPPAFVSSALAAPGVREYVSVFRSLDDFKRVQKAAETGNGIIVVGGGFLGTELAIVLAGVSKNVSFVVAEVGVLYRVLPRYLCEHLAKKIEDLGVRVICSAIVTDANISKRDEKEGNNDSAVGKETKEISSVQNISVSLLSSTGREEVSGEHVVVAAGIEPEVRLARDAGLEIDTVRGGVMVNDFMMAEPDVFVAGDMASFHDRTLGRRRVEHWDHAVVTGRIAGANMCGARDRYGLQSMFWSDLTNIGVEITAVGLVDSKLETIGVWNTAMPCVEDVPSMNDLVSGVVYYVSRKREIVGVVLWNAQKGSGALRRARALVDARTSVNGLSQRTLGDLVNISNGSFRMYVPTKAL